MSADDRRRRDMPERPRRYVSPRAVHTEQRTDECTPPPNWRDLDGYLNTNGTVCLNYVC